MPGDSSSDTVHLNPHSALVEGLRVLIAGAGIAGLSVAIGLARAGFKDVTICEASRTLGEVGLSYDFSRSGC